MTTLVSSSFKDVAVKPFDSLLILLAVAFVMAPCGCQGLKGVRYHDGDICESCDATDIAYAEDSIGRAMSEPIVAPAALPPHSRFHPLPTRPVFEPQQASHVTPARHAAAVLQSDGDAAAADLAPPITAFGPESASDNSARSPARQDSAESLLSPIADEAAETPSSRRKPAVSLESPGEDGEFEDAPPSPTPAESPTAHSNNLWRPRVAGS